MARDSSKPVSNSDGSVGFNPKKVRAFNERLVLSIIRRHGAMAKSEITRRSGLSAQAVSVIMRELEHEGFILRGEPIKGRKGQPSIPMRLNPEGACSFGLKLGRRSSDLILIDFVGAIQTSISITYSYPMPEVILAFAHQGISDMLSKMSDAQREKVAGIGVAVPYDLWNWDEQTGVPSGALDVWKTYDIAAALENATGLLTFSQNDGTAACGAELVFGRGMEFSDFVYFYVGTLVGGGITLNNTIYAGRTSNAGALGSMPVGISTRLDGQLFDFASLFTLEKRLQEAGMDASILYQGSYRWQQLGPILEDWLDDAARSIARAIASATTIIDFQVAIIDGSMPLSVRSLLVDKVRSAIGEKAWKGIELPAVLEGSIGSPARALGAASLPLFVRYLLDQNQLFRDF